ncbi:MAG: TldD/PmbA family protein [Deltaproteobacteria bacterium]|nr:TldD/PmbA family protein [Deltaproteobacteria bacterium]
MFQPPSRRALLGHATAGAALLTLPRFLAGCAHTVATDGAITGAVPADPFAAWFGLDSALIQRVLGALTARGADFGEVYLQHARTTNLALEDGIIGRASTSIDQGAGLRVVMGDQVGYAFTEDLSEQALLAAARTAAAIASGGGGAPPAELVLDPGSHGMYSLEVPWSRVGADRKLPLLTALEAKVKAKDPSIVKVGVTWNDGEERVLVADTTGRITRDERPSMRVWATVTAKRGEQTVTNSANLAGRHGFGWLTDARLDALAEQAVSRTLILFDAVRPPAGEMPVVLAAGASGILLHEAIGHGMEADFNRKGTSLYSTMIGQRIAPDFVTLIDSGLEPNERGALNVDDEGTDAQRTTLVENGILKTFLHDRISAKHYGLASTGSGRRESFRHVVMPRMRCTFMENGPHTRDEIIASVKSGIIAETFTNGQVQIGAGDFTFYVKNGWLIENGAITRPIKDVNIIGNGPEALKRVSMAANDMSLDTGGWTCGKDGQSVPVSQGLPTVKVDALTVGGVRG